MDPVADEAPNLPLCFPVDLPMPDGAPLAVQARALTGHQKEAVVAGGDTARAWRLLSDEGPGLGGTDIAPFPLGFWNAGLMADCLQAFLELCRSEHIQVESVGLAAATDYVFSGSFFAGTGKGVAIAPRLHWTIASARPDAELRALVDAALDRSAVVALLREPLRNTFGLQVNGRLRELTSLPATLGDPPADPLKQWQSRPQPAAGWSSEVPLIERLTTAGPTAVPPGAAAGTSAGTSAAAGAAGAASSASGSASSAAASSAAAPARMPGEAQRIEIPVRGIAAVGPQLLRSEVFFDRLSLSRFALQAANRSGAAAAPSGVALALAGVSFCLLTQLLRYVEYRKLALRGLRLVQVSELPRDASGRPSAAPLATQVFMNGDESAQVMEDLLRMSANTCYLHAALGSALEPQVQVN